MKETNILIKVTESAYSSLSVNANDFLSTLHQRGNMILMDDFGSGVSSLSTIHDFEFDILKLIWDLCVISVIAKVMIVFLLH